MYVTRTLIWVTAYPGPYLPHQAFSGGTAKSRNTAVRNQLTAVSDQYANGTRRGKLGWTPLPCRSDAAEAYRNTSKRCSHYVRSISGDALPGPGFIVSSRGLASSAGSKRLPREAPLPAALGGGQRGLTPHRPRRASPAAGQGQAGPPGAAPAVPAAPRTAASRDGDGRGAPGASPAGRPRPAPPSAPPAAASSSAGRSARRRRRVSCSSPPLRLPGAAGLRQGPFCRLPGMAAAAAAPHPPRRGRRRHFAGERAAPPPIGRRRAASSGHWLGGRGGAGPRRARRGTAAAPSPPR